MTLRRKVAAYIALLHLVLSAAIVVLLWENRVWLIAVEIFLLISIVFAVQLFRKLFQPLDVLLAGAEWLNEGDFSTRLRLTGQPEMDGLIGVYNRMIDTLREERVRLQERQYFLEKVIDASPAGMITLDFDGKVAHINPSAERLLRLTRTEVQGLPLAGIPSPLTPSLSALAVGESRVLPLQGIRRIKCTASQFIDRGSPRSFYVLEELTDELRQSEKSAYEKLIRMMSHEVNNSVGAANSLLHSSLQYKNQLREEDRADFESALTIAISRADHLNVFMKSFADIVRLPPPARQEVDLRTILMQVCTLMEPECARRGISVRREFTVGREVKVNVDLHQMEQVLVNIFKNAIEAIGRDGVVTVRMEPAGSRTVVTIEDSGGGIPPAMKPMIFTPFFSTKENGQGIGLTLVQEILTQHRLEFSLESEPGGATRFAIYFL